MYVNGKVREIGELREVQFPDGPKSTRQVVIDFLGDLYQDKVKGVEMQREQTLVIEVWNGQASNPKYQVGDIVDVIFDCNAASKDGKWWNNIRARVILPPLRDEKR